MSRLARYVAQSVFFSMLIALGLLLGLELVFSFIGELDRVRGSYTAYEALMYVLMSAPASAYELLSPAVLIGGITGLGMLANHSELTVMRAAGVSLWRIVAWVMVPALCFALAGLWLAQTVVPSLEGKADARRAAALGKNASADWLKSYWHRDGQQVLRIGAASPDGSLRDVVFFHYADNGRLAEVSRAATARYEQGRWHLANVCATVLAADGRAHVHCQAEQWWQGNLTPDFIRLAMQNTEHLALTHLYQYAQYLRAQDLNADSYVLEFWKKALSPLAILSMMLVACSFIFGPLRSVTMGLRILAGVLAGLLFRYGQDFLGYASLVYHFPPLLAALLPIALCCTLGAYALMRVR